MRLIFIHHVIEDRGSAQDMWNYVAVARALGHEVALYGPSRPAIPFQHRLDVEAADAVIFLFEWTTELQYGDQMDLLRLVGRVPRRRRVVIDCDGKYNDAISVNGDRNHADDAASCRWTEVCDSLSDKIYQPTLHPRRANVRPFFFHAYNPAWEDPIDFRRKEFGMIYVGNNWFRWRSLRRVFETIERVREHIGRIALIGNGWNTPAPWANSSLPEEAYGTDPGYLERLGVEVLPPVRFDRVVEQMGRGAFSPVIYRPLFDQLRLVTCRTFETPAAGTLPLFAQDPAFVAEVFGDDATELALPATDSGDKVLDLLRRPEHYARIVLGIRRRLAGQHSYEARLKELIEIVRA